MLSITEQIQYFRIYFEVPVDYDTKKIFLNIRFDDYSAADEYANYLNQQQENIENDRNFNVQAFYEQKKEGENP